MSGLRYHRDAERPEAVLTLPDGVDVSTGYTFVVRIGRPGEEAVVEKTTGITGGDGVVTVAWAAGELADLVKGRYTMQVTATTGGLDRVYECPFEAVEVITAQS